MEVYESRLMEANGPVETPPEVTRVMEWFEGLTGIPAGAHFGTLGVIAFPDEFLAGIAAWKAWHDQNRARLRVDTSGEVTVK